MRQCKTLSAREVATITAPGRYSDGRNLYLLVSKTASGGLSKRWTFLYKLNGRRREAGLGSALDVGLKEARGRAAEYRILISLGKDPLQVKAAKTVPVQKTLHQCMVEFVESKQRDWKPGRSAGYGYAATFHREFTRLGRLNDMPVGAIDTEAVLQAIKPVWAEYKSACTVLAKLERVLDAAKVRGLRSGDNPARWKGHIDQMLPKRPQIENYAAMPYADVPAFVVRLRDDSFHCHDAKDRYRKREEGSLVRRHTSAASQALELLILTATRQQETVAARWSEVDLEQALWTIPAARTKSKREHQVPLPRQAVALLKRRKELQISSEFVFPGQTKNARGPIAGGAPLQVMRNLGIEPETATTHGFRSSFKDWACNETDFADEISEEALSHAVGDTTRRSYRREVALDKRRALMQAWADYVAPDHG